MCDVRSGSDLDGTVYVVASLRARDESNALAASVARCSAFLLQAMLLSSCLTFDLAFRLVAAIGLGCFLLTDYRGLNVSRRTYFAIMLSPR